MKLVSRALLVFVIFTGLFFVSIPDFGTVQATDVNGILSSDTTWTKEDSPVKLTGPVLVSVGVTLTIEAGVQVNLNGHYILVNGTLHAVGTSDEPISIGGGTYEMLDVNLTEFSTSWNEQTGSGTLIEYASMSLEIHEVTPKITNSHLGHTKIFDTSLILSGLTFDRYAELEVFGGSPVISNNFFNGSVIHVWGGSPLISNNNITGVLSSNNFKYYPEYGVNIGGVRLDGVRHSHGDINAHVSGNTIVGHQLIGVYAAKGTTIIENNLIANSEDGIYVTGEATIQDNTIVNNEFGIRLDDCPLPTISNNNFQNNDWMNLLLDDITTDVDATNNWWGTTNTTAISEGIKDFNDDFNLGTVKFTPFLTEANTQAPLAPASLSIAVSTPSTEVGAPINVYGKLTDISGNKLDHQLVTVSYSTTGDNWTPIGSHTTSTIIKGEYEIQWPNPEYGTIMLKAQWEGQGVYGSVTTIIFLSSLSYLDQNVFFIQSNSVIEDLVFNATNSELRFVATGDSGTKGNVRATIPRNLLDASGAWTILIDGNQVTPKVYVDADKTTIDFSYQHSTKTIQILGQNGIPEFSSWIIVPLMLAMFSIIVIYKKKTKLVN